MNEISPDQAFNIHRVPHEPRHVIADPPIRLRGDILVSQVVAKVTPAWLAEIIWTAAGLTRLLVWELPKLAVEIAVLDPLQRRRWRQGKR